MRYIIFSRVSTGKQTTENQIGECLEYVRQNIRKGDEIIQFDEKALSTRNRMEDRPVLMKMLNSLKKGDTLVIYKLSRLARAGDELVRIWHDLQRKGIILVSLYEKQIDEMIIHAYAMVGQAERKNIREATKSGLKRKQNNREKVGQCLYGYKTDPTKLQLQRPDVHSYGKPYLLIPEDDESRQVSLMLGLHKEGFSYGQIADRLKEEGFVNRAGNPVTKMTIYRIVQRTKGGNQSLVPLR